MDSDTIRIKYGNEWIAVSGNIYGDDNSYHRAKFVWKLNGGCLQSGTWDQFMNVLRALKERHPRDTANIVVSYVHTYWSEDDGFALGY